MVLQLVANIQCNHNSDFHCFSNITKVMEIHVTLPGMFSSEKNKVSIGLTSRTKNRSSD